MIVKLLLTDHRRTPSARPTRGSIEPGNGRTVTASPDAGTVHLFLVTFRPRDL